MILKVASALLLLAPAAQGQLINNQVTGCVVEADFDPTIDYFPDKYVPPVINTYDTTTDIFGEQFVPHNTTDLLEIVYFPSYKIVYNKHQNVSYLLYQCGTVPPQDEIDSGRHHLVLPVPHTGGVAITQTPQIPPLELLGRREDIIAIVGDPQYISSECLLHRMEEGDIEIVYGSNRTARPQLRAEWLERNPNAIIFGGPTDEAPWSDRTIQVAASQERTNVATFDWIALFAALFNLEGMSNQISEETQARYDCTSTNARMIVDQRQRRRLEEESRQLEGNATETAENATAHGMDMETMDAPMDPTNTKVLWAVHFTGYNWSVAYCPTWDSAYYCEYATHCGTNIISRPPDLGYWTSFGGPTKYWYLNDDELLEIGKDADVWIFPSNRWDDVYAAHNETMDQIKAVKNKQVYDNQGSGSNAWFEQRLAEYDVVGLDLCDIVGTANPNGPPHTRRWFRNIFTEEIGGLPQCQVPEELTEPYVPQGAECELLTEEDFMMDDTMDEEIAEAETMDEDTQLTEEEQEQEDETTDVEEEQEFMELVEMVETGELTLDDLELPEESPADQVSKQGDEESSKEPVSSAAATTFMGAVATFFVAVFAL